MFSKIRTFAILGSSVLFIALLLAPATASAATIRAQVDGPIVLADQVFDGGEIKLTSVGSGSLMAVRIDGRQVALVHHQQDGRSDHGIPVLTFERDESGQYHLLGVRYKGVESRDRGIRFVPLAVATVAKGDRALAPATAIAQVDSDLVAR